jgi:Tfp pilus assembly protein PilF
MNELLFWKSWTSAERWAVGATLFFLAVSMILVFSFSGFFSVNGGVKWDVLSQLTDVQIPANFLDVGSFTFEISAPSVFVTEQYVAPLMRPDTTGGVIFLCVSFLGLSLVLAALTRLSRFWYLGGTAVFILLLVFSRTELIALQNLPKQSLLILALLLYVGVGYYFHAFNTHIGMATRVLAFAGISLCLLAVVQFFSPAPYSLYALLAYTLPLWLIPALIFFVVSATEIVYGLVWLATSKATGMGKRTLMNLGILLAIYLLVLIFAYVGNTKMADWGIVLLPVYFLGGLAAVIGVFGFKARCEGTEGHIPFREVGFWLYGGLFMVALGATGMAVMANNDPLLEVMEDTVVNAQLGMSAAFIFYLIANFLPLLRKGLPVHKVLYKPMNFGLSKARIIGFGLVVVLFSMQNLFPLKQGIAGYFNNLGDIHTLTNQPALAEQYYKMSLQQEFQNHKANYGLASLARDQGDQNAAVFYFRQATLKKPSPQAYVGLANLLADEDLYFEAVFSLKEGAKLFPDNGPILNNLGLLYGKTNLSDSAFYYLERAARTSKDGIPAANAVATLVGVLLPAELDSLASALSGSANLALKANQLLTQNLGRVFKEEALRGDAIAADSLLNAAQYAYWFNYAYNQSRFDRGLSEAVRRIASKNAVSTDELLLASAHADFYGGDKKKALETMLSLSSGGQSKYSGYKNILGHWFLQLGLYDKAAAEFAQVEGPEALVGHALAETFLGNPVAGIILLEKLGTTGRDSLEVDRLQKAVAAARPLSNKADSLLSAARSSGQEQGFREALRYNPYDPVLVTGVADFYIENKKDVSTAYALVVDAMRFNENSHLLWAYYSLLNLEMGLTEQAEEGRDRVKALADDAAYHDFSTRYQAKRSLKQKERDAF